MSPTARIFLVEDDREICSVVQDFLRQSGHTCFCAADGLTAQKDFSQARPDLVLLDLMLPYFSGDRFLAWLRGRSQIPVIVLSAKNLTQDKISLLRLGADDYLTKPFDLEELLARIESLLRRAGCTSAPDVLSFHGLRIDLKAHEARCGETALALTAKEFQLLALLAGQPGRAFTKFEIYQAVWNGRADENTLNAHISTLRRKLRQAGLSENCIETLYGVGYKLG